MKIKTHYLTGQALDWVVAKCEGMDEETLDPLTWVYTAHPSGGYDYSTDWSQGGPIIERERISLVRCDDDYGTDSKGFTTPERIPVWFAEHGGGHSTQTFYEGEYYDPQYELSEDGGLYGLTPLIAAMRCYVDAKLGDEVEIPDELGETT